MRWGLVSAACRERYSEYSAMLPGDALHSVGLWTWGYRRPRVDVWRPRWALEFNDEDKSYYGR